MRRFLLVGLAGCERLLSLAPLPAADGGGAMPAFVQAAVWTDDTSNAQQIDLPVTLDADASLCLVTVGLDGNDPTIDGVTYAGTPMTSLVSVRGVAGTPDVTGTVTEQWWLAAPTLPAGDVVVTMGQAGLSAQVSALFFAGVSLARPFRDMQVESGYDDHSELTLTTSSDDLVESVTGQGAGVSGAGAISTEVFVHNVDTTTSLDNAAGSVTPSSGPRTTIAWQYTGADRFQTIAASIAPASR